MTSNLKWIPIMKKLGEFIKNWWRRKMLDRAVAKVGLNRCYSPFDIGYQPEGEKLDNFPTPPKGGTSQTYFQENFKILSEKISDDGKHVEILLEAKKPMTKITIEGVIKL